MLAKSSRKRVSKAQPGADRYLSGGLIKPKLTEVELSTKVERMRVINASIEERYQREEADRAAFKAQEEALLRDLRIRREEALREKAS
ncbi:hypothetical protein K3495_g10403 [Podosphaera aphanis]|nr:hypothetical protein K3495_g10403 [Podosphaera aphanis]